MAGSSIDEAPDPSPAYRGETTESVAVAAESDDAPRRRSDRGREPAAPPEPPSAPASEPEKAPTRAPSKKSSLGDEGVFDRVAEDVPDTKPRDTTIAGGLESPRRRAVPPPPPASGLKAGAADDNLQFGAFLDFVDSHRDAAYRSDLSDRVIVEVKDEKGLPMPGATVELRRGARALQRRRTYADGRALVYPSETDAKYRQDLSVFVRHAGLEKTVSLADDDTHRVVFRLLRSRAEVDRIPLDIAFVLDATGSMGDELLRLKQTIDAIHLQIEHLDPRPDVRFGLVSYRDRGDDYVTQHVPFTRDLRTFQRALAAVQAGGGNDYPEDVQAGLESALHDLRWRDDGVRVAFLVGDAPPHLDYEQSFTYLDAAREAAERGIKIATIGASGLSKTGEVVWRQIAQYTMSPFVFLTYGETGDSGPGTPALVSHHVGSNWVAENLDAIVVRMVKVELAHLSPRGAPPREDFFAATSARDVPTDVVLEDLFAQSVKQLLDYSVERIAPRTPTVLMPVSGSDESATDKLGRRLMVGLSRRSQFLLLESEKRKELLTKLADQLSEKYEASGATEVGRLVPAKLAVLSSVSSGKDGKVEMLVKLVRLQTGEVLSLSLLKIDEALLL